MVIEARGATKHVLFRNGFWGSYFNGLARHTGYILSQDKATQANHIKLCLKSCHESTRSHHHAPMAKQMYHHKPPHEFEHPEFKDAEMLVIVTTTSPRPDKSNITYITFAYKTERTK